MIFSGCKFEKPIKISGTCLDYKWANHSDYLAVLAVKKNWKQTIYIIDPKLSKIVKKIQLKEKLSANCLCWDSNDKRLIISMSEEYQVNDLYYYSLTTERFEKFPDDFEKLYSGISGLLHEPLSRRWAALYYAEGHPDVAVYNDETNILNTSVFPGNIDFVCWHKGALVVSSNIPLNKGLTMAERKDIADTGDDNYYRIDINTKKAEVVDNGSISLESLSQSGKYTADVKFSDEESFEVIIRTLK